MGKVIFVDTCGDCPLCYCHNGIYYCKYVSRITDIGKISEQCQLSESSHNQQINAGRANVCPTCGKGEDENPFCSNSFHL